MNRVIAGRYANDVFETSNLDLDCRLIRNGPIDVGVLTEWYDRIFRGNGISYHHIWSYIIAYRRHSFVQEWRRHITNLSMDVASGSARGIRIPCNCSHFATLKCCCYTHHVLKYTRLCYFQTKELPNFPWRGLISPLPRPSPFNTPNLKWRHACECTSSPHSANPGYANMSSFPPETAYSTFCTDFTEYWLFSDFSAVVF